MKIESINFDVKGDERGSLIALESNKNIPFDIKRVYYIFGTKPNVVRGKHAHKKLQQVAQENGMLTLVEDGIKKVIKGMTTFEEILRITKE